MNRQNPNPRSRQPGYPGGQNPRQGNQQDARQGSRQNVRQGTRPDVRQNARQNPRSQQNRYPGGQNPRQNAGQNGYPDPRTMTPEQRAQWAAYQRQKKQQAEARRRAREEAEQRARQREKELRAIERRENLKILGGRLLVFAVILVLIAAVAGGLFLLFFHSTPDETDDGGQVRYTFGGREVRKIDLAEAIIEVHGEDRMYICFNDAAHYLGMAQSGSAQEMKFVLAKSEADTAAGDGMEEIIVFTTDAAEDADETTVTINGQVVKMKHPNILRGTEVWVESGFFEEQMVNLSYRYDEKTRTVEISRIKDEEHSTEEETVYLPVSFKLKAEKPIEPVPEDPLIGDVTYGEETGEIDLAFKTDLSEYEEYMNPTGDKRDAFLILVNTKNTLTENDVPTDLVDCQHTSSARKIQQLREYAAKALDALYQEMKANQFYNMAVYSGFRTYSYQATLFESYTGNEMANNPALTREQAEAIVLTYSTRPGTSEHQTGLAVDMDTRGDFSTEFAYTAEYAWLQENAWKFGFILRFPADKVDVTTIQFEPWHYRYVGRYHAQKIHASGLCLEEYIAQLNP